ncbi:hypothetical protein [Methanomethylovorans sp.]|uniref:hypothetical protein n=1 Tax=Methanomethylovorans sp. TaxID=2758717 RepID=UPI002FDD3CC3
MFTPLILPVHGYPINNYGYNDHKKIDHFVFFFTFGKTRPIKEISEMYPKVGIAAMQTENSEHLER